MLRVISEGDPRQFTLPQAGRIVGVNADTIRKWARRGVMQTKFVVMDRGQRGDRKKTAEVLGLGDLISLVNSRLQATQIDVCQGRSHGAQWIEAEDLLSQYIGAYCHDWTVAVIEGDAVIMIEPRTPIEEKPPEEVVQKKQEKKDRIKRGDKVYIKVDGRTVPAIVVEGNERNGFKCIHLTKEGVIVRAETTYNVRRRAPAEPIDWTGVIPLRRPSSGEASLSQPLSQ